MATSSCSSSSSAKRDVRSSNPRPSFHPQILERSYVDCTDVLFGLRLRRRRRRQNHHHRRTGPLQSNNNGNDTNHNNDNINNNDDNNNNDNFRRLQLDAAAPLTPDRLATATSAQRPMEGGIYLTEDGISLTENRHVRQTDYLNGIAAVNGQNPETRSPDLINDRGSVQLNSAEAEELGSAAGDREEVASTGRPASERSIPEIGSDASSSTIAEIFKCFICLGKVVDAQLCPCCSNLVCLSCIKRWLLEQKSQCPHCRAPLLVSQLVNCKFISEITQELEKMRVKATNGHSEKLCSIHENPLSYFCSTCSLPVCSDCAILDEDHRNHSFERIIVAYGRHKKKIHEEAASLRQHLKELSLLVVTIDENIESVLKVKDEKLVEMQATFECMRMRLEEQLKSKLQALLAQKGSMTQKMELVETVLHELDEQLNKIPKSDLIAQEPMMCRMLQDIRNRTVAEARQTPVPTDFISEVVPPYEYGELVINDFRSHLSEVKPQGSSSGHNCETNNGIDVSKEVVYSKALFASGVTWRLKVYPNGSGASRGTHISVFLEMLEGNIEPSMYEYGIEMLHRRLPHQNVMRKFSSDFEVGACWGYYQFFQIDLLEKEGYLVSDEDTITLCFYVRALTFQQQCQDLKRSLAAVRVERDDAMAHVAVLRRALAANIQQHHQRKTSLASNLEETCNDVPTSETSRKLSNSNINRKDQYCNFQKSEKLTGDGKHSNQGMTCSSHPEMDMNQSTFYKRRHGNDVDEKAITLNKDVTGVKAEGNLEFGHVIPSKNSVQASSKEKCEVWLRARDEICQVPFYKARVHGKMQNKWPHKCLINTPTTLHTHHFEKEKMPLESMEKPSISDEVVHDDCARVDKAPLSSSFCSSEAEGSCKDESIVTDDSPKYLPIEGDDCNGLENAYSFNYLSGDMLHASEHGWSAP